MVSFLEQVYIRRTRPGAGSTPVIRCHHDVILSLLFFLSLSLLLLKISDED
jgi:hypothetical protein